MIRFTTILIALFAFLFVSCHKEAPQQKKKVNPDKVVRVGLVSTLDALPLMVAKEWGILDSLGIDVDVSVYKSQLDAEQALAAGKVDMAMSDMFRVGWWQSQRKPVAYMFNTSRPMVIVPSKALRINNMSQLDDRMIAIANHSVSDYYAKKLVEGISKRNGQILYPSINDPEVRLNMLLANQLDAVLLSPLQAYKSQAEGYKSLKVDTKSPEGFTGFAVNTIAMHKKSRLINKIESAYNLAVGRLHKNKSISSISQETHRALHLTQAVDSLCNPKRDFAFTSQAELAKVSQAVNWLKTHGVVKASYSGDTLVVR